MILLLIAAWLAALFHGADPATMRVDVFQPGAVAVVWLDDHCPSYEAAACYALAVSSPGQFEVAIGIR